MLNICEPVLTSPDPWANTAFARDAFPSVTYSREPTIASLSSRLDAYVLRKKLGEGAFGEVWLAETCLAGDEHILVALKTIRRESLSRDNVTSIHEEQRLSKYLTDTDGGLGYFPQLVESFSDENNYYIVQEFVPGGTLRDEMERSGGRVTLDRAKCILAQLITVVRRMHLLGVMHRDIKPENILFDAAGNVVLADFGLSYRFARTNDTSEGYILEGNAEMAKKRCGTPGYMAPEAIFGEPYTYSIDMYSVGVVFYEVLLGVQPFPQHSLRDMTSAMLQHAFAIPLSVLPMEAALLVRGLLKKDPLKRISANAILMHPFFAGIDWRLVATRKYDMPVEWAPPIVLFDHEKEIDKSVLVDWMRKRNAMARRRLPAFDRDFISPRRAPTVERPSAPAGLHERQLDVRRKAIGALRIAGIRRGAVRELTAPRVASVSQPVTPVQAKAVTPLEAMRRFTALEEGGIADELNTTSPRAKHKQVHEPVIDVTEALQCTDPIKLLDDTLLSPAPSTSPGTNPAFGFALQVPPPSPLSPSSDAAVSENMQNHLCPPTVPALDMSGMSPPISPGPMTPTSTTACVFAIKDCA